jgi:hypothetical protein
MLRSTPNAYAWFHETIEPSACPLMFALVQSGAVTVAVKTTDSPG